MAKDPAVLLYTQDFLIGSSLMTPAQKGHYVTLLCYQQQSDTGSLTIEEVENLMQSDFEKLWPVVKRKFKEDQNGFYNSRMRSEVERRAKYSESRRTNRKGNPEPPQDIPEEKTAPEQSYVPTHDTTYVPTYDNHMSTHMETETEIEIVSRDKGVQGEKGKEKSETFLKFEKWVKENAKRVSQMKEPFTQTEFESLLQSYDRKLIMEVVTEMHNHKKISEKISANLTAKNWLRRRELDHNQNSGTKVITMKKDLPANLKQI